MPISSMNGHRGPGHRGNSTRAESDQDLLRRDQSSHRAAAAGGHSQNPDEAANMAAKLKAKGGEAIKALNFNDAVKHYTAAIALKPDGEFPCDASSTRTPLVPRPRASLLKE